MFKTIEGTVNCEILSVIRFLNAWKTPPHRHGESSDNFHMQNYIHHFQGQKSCHVGGFHTQKQNRQCYCLRWKTCGVPFKTWERACLLMESFCCATMPGNMQLMWLKISFSPTVGGVFHGTKFLLWRILRTLRMWYRIGRLSPSVGCGKYNLPELIYLLTLSFFQ